MTKLVSSNVQKKWSRIVKISLPIILAGACLYFILTGFQWAKIWQALQTIDLVMFLVTSILTTIFFWLLRAIRWAVLTKNENFTCSFFKLYLYTAVMIGFANFTPFQSGEALKVEFLRRHGGKRFSDYNYFFFEKTVDLFIIAILAAFGVWTIFNEFVDNYLQSVIISLVLLLAVLILAFVFGLNKLSEVFRNHQRIMVTTVSRLFLAILLTTMSWMTMIFGWKFIFQSAAINLTIAQTAAIISLTTIIGLLSFVPSAVGVSEISIAALLSQLGYGIVTAQTGAILIALYTLVILILVIIHLVLLKTRNIMENKKKDIPKGI